ncbi:MAG: hypothetical protein NTX25_11470, partial [Proteobacteria bacterium]|nr:hypothetical protein [Pseudomonadota bacterium]
MLKSLKKLAILLSLLVALSYLGNLLIDNPYVHGVIRSTINEKLEKDTHVAIKFEAINVKFLPPRLDIYGIEIRQKIPDMSDKILAQIAHLQVGISPLALILSRTEMFDIQVNEPRLSLPLPKLEDLLKMDQFPDWTKPSQLQ